jgi:hypothetical protein
MVNRKGGNMSDETYNGWSNYETWAVGMWLDGNYTGQGTYDAATEIVRANLGGTHERYDVKTALQDWFESENDIGEIPARFRCEIRISRTGIHSDLLGAALSSVDWYELADAWIENAREAARP